MSNLVEKVDPKVYGLEEVKANELTKGLDVAISERDVLIEAYKDVISLEINEENLETFKSLRLQIVKNRTQGINKWHTASKSFFLAGGRFVDAIKNKEILINEQMEAKLLEAEKHFENLEKERIDKLQKERVALLSEFLEDASERNLASMEQDVWDSFLATKNKAYLDRIAKEEAEEQDRIAKEKAEKEAIEKQRLDNLRLQKEAEKREKEIEAERKENLRIAKIESDKRDKIEAERLAKLKIEKDIYEAKIKKQEDELKAIKDAELKAIKDAELKLIEEQKEAEKREKAPIKKQLSIWVDSFSIPEIKAENEKKKLILEKFESFKNWAKKEINNI